MKNFNKILFAVAFAMIIMAGSISMGNPVNTSAASRKCYSIGTANARVYSDTGLTKGYGWIYPTDEITSSVAQKIVNYELSRQGIGDKKGNNNVKYNTWFYNKAVSGSGYACKRNNTFPLILCGFRVIFCSHKNQCRLKKVGNSG